MVMVNAAESVSKYRMARAAIDMGDFSVAEIMALSGANVTPATPVACQTALDYLLATMQAEISWLRGFASSLRSDQLVWRQAAPDSKMRSEDKVGI